MRNRIHSLCPYFAMFPETFAEKWIDRITEPGDCVLDPFSGRGTTLFSALLKDRRAVGSDVNSVAYCLTKAKSDVPSLGSLRRRVTQLEKGFDGRNWSRAADALPDFFRHAYCRDALLRILYLRSELKWRKTTVDGMLAAVILGALHGEINGAESYLSNQMPRTISTKPNYSINFWRQRGLLQAPKRDVFNVLRSRLSFRFENAVLPEKKGIALNLDVRKLSYNRKIPRDVNCVITSPPYFDVTNYEEDQWLRLWFLGGAPQPNRSKRSRDDRHTFSDSYWRFIADMWRTLGAVLTTGSNIVIRIGSTRIAPEEISRLLFASAVFSGRKVRLVSSKITEIVNRQTNSFRPGTAGCRVEVDCHFEMA